MDRTSHAYLCTHTQRSITSPLGNAWNAPNALQATKARDRDDHPIEESIGSSCCVAFGAVHVAVGTIWMHTHDNYGGGEALCSSHRSFSSHSLRIVYTALYPINHTRIECCEEFVPGSWCLAGRRTF
jgi:hypothetical protein